MEDKLLNEINRFREISKLPLLTEQKWLDDLVNRVPSLDTLISKLGYKNKNLTNGEIDVIIDELKSNTKLKNVDLETLRGWLIRDESLRNALTREADNFVGKLKGLKQLKTNSLSGFDKVVELTDNEIQIIAKNMVNNLLSLETSSLSKGFTTVDNDISSGLQSIYDNGLSLYSIDEMYNIFDGFINRTLSNNKVDSDIGEEIFQLFKRKVRTNSKTKELLDKFNLENRSLDRQPRVGEVNYNDNILPVEWDSASIWVGKGGNGEMVTNNITDIPTNTTDNFFSGAKIDSNFLNSYISLKNTLKQLKVKLQNSKSGDAGVEKLKEKIKNIENYLNSLNKGVTTKTDDIFNDLKGYLNTRQIEQLRIRLENPQPVKKIGNVGSPIFWTLIEPIIANLRELYKSDRVDWVLKNITKNSPESALDEFMKTLESVQINFNENVTEAQIKALKDKFVRLKSDGSTSKTYKQLYNDLDDFLKSKLDDTAKEEWETIKTQLMAENPSSWMWVTWKEMIDDPNLIKGVENQVYKFDNKLAKLFTGKEEKIVIERSASKFINLIRNKYGNIFSLLIKGKYQTPKEFKRYLINNGYARKGILGKWGLSPAGKNYVQQWFISTLLLPLIYASVEFVVEGLRNTGVGASYDDDTFVENFLHYFKGGFVLKIMEEDIKEASPEWYQFLSPIIDFTVKSPVLKLLKTSLEGKLLDFKTPEEKDLEKLDKEISDVEESLKNKPPKLLVEDFERWKRIINETMLKREPPLVNPQTAKLVTDNMSIKYKVDPNVVNGLKQSIKKVHSDGSIIEKAKEIGKIISGATKSLNDSAVEDIVVTTPNSIFKLIMDDYKGVMYVEPDYETLKKTPNVKQTTKPLNELKF